MSSRQVDMEMAIGETAFLAYFGQNLFCVNPV